MTRRKSWCLFNHQILRGGLWYVNETYLDIKELFCQYWRTLINWLTRTIEHSTQHFNTHGHTEYITCKFTSGAHVVDTGSTFENLYTKSKWRLRGSNDAVYLPVQRPVYLWFRGPDPFLLVHFRDGHLQFLRILGTWRCQEQQVVLRHQGQFCNRFLVRCCNRWWWLSCERRSRLRFFPFLFLILCLIKTTLFFMLDANAN